VYLQTDNSPHGNKAPTKVKAAPRARNAHDSDNDDKPNLPPPPPAKPASLTAKRNLRQQHAPAYKAKQPGRPPTFFFSLLFCFHPTSSRFPLLFTEHTHGKPDNPP
jgi:hypothetical protein